MHCPPGFAPRPRNTGWYASFASLSGPQDASVMRPTESDSWARPSIRAGSIACARHCDGWRHTVSMPRTIHAHVIALQEIFLHGISGRPIGLFDPARLVVPASEMSRGNFLTFDHPDAATWQTRLKAKEHRGGCARIRLRVGFGLYHNAGDVERLLQPAARRLTLDESVRRCAQSRPLQNQEKCPGLETWRKRRKVIITCAVTGSIHTPSMSPHLPVTRAGDRRRRDRRCGSGRRDRASARAQSAGRPARPDAGSVRAVSQGDQAALQRGGEHHDRRRADHDASRSACGRPRPSSRKSPRSTWAR